MIWLWLCAIVWSHPKIYSASLAPDTALSFHIQHQDTILFSLYTQDGQQRQRYEWLQDRDPRRGKVQVQLPQFILPPDQYTLVVESPIQTKTYELSITAPVSETTIDTQTAASSVIGWNEQSIAWAPVQTDTTLSIIGTHDGRWEYWAIGSRLPFSSMNNDNDLVLRLREMISSPPVHSTQPVPLWIWIYPFLIIGGFLYAVRSATKEWTAGILSGIIVAYIATRGIWTDPFSLRLQANGPIYDPIDSMALMNHVWQGISNGSSFGTAYSWPNGSSWWTGGPVWMIYALGGALSSISNAIFAHNLLITAQYGLLGFCGWLLGKNLGLRQSLAILAGISAGLSPMIIDEADAISLDRGSFFIVPLYLLCLHRTLSPNTTKKWLIAAGLCLGISLHLQVYYGVFLALASPFFVLWHALLLPEKKSLLLRATGVAVVAIITMTPALYALDNLTSSSYDIEHGSFEFTQLDQHWVNQKLSGPETNTIHNSNSTERVLSAARFSLSIEDALSPKEWLIGGHWYWGLILLSLLLSRHRRQIALWTLNGATLLIFSLGPLLIYNGQWTGALMPYAYFWDIPGFSQLRNLHRFALLAATISTIPILLCLEQLLQRSQHRLVALGWIPFLFLLWPLPILSMIDSHRINKDLSQHHNSTAMLLPYQRIASPWQAKIGASYNLRLVNPPTFEQGDAPLSLVEYNGFINRLACLSGYTDICFAQGDLQYYKAQAKTAKVDLIIIAKDYLARQQDIKQLLSSLSSLETETEEYQIWRVDIEE